MKPIGITMGDPAGVGPEVLLSALAAEPGAPPVRVFGDRGVLESRARALRLPLDFELIEASRLPPTLLPGRFTPEGGRAALAYLEAAAVALERSEISALVTGPIHKRALSQDGAHGPGQTEWLGWRFGIRRPVMMLAGPRLRVVLATTHLALRRVADALDRTALVETVQVASVDLRRFFFTAGPRFALCALNPHGEVDGFPGPEEEEILAPAVSDLRGQGIDIAGPVPADAVFAQALSGRFDVVVALYHDQGLAPLKVLHLNEAVNVTLGLGKIRTSPDHGVAYDIAGRGLAEAGSTRAAIRLAVEMASRQEAGFRE